MTTPPNIAALAGSLTGARQNAILKLLGGWFAGPFLPKGVGGQRLTWLVGKGLVERKFGDLSEAWADVPGGLEVRLSACWWYRLTPLGQQIAAYLMEQRHDGQG